MSDFRFGVDDYSLDYHPHEGVRDEHDCIDWSKVECVEIDWVTFVQERTCELDNDRNCSNCGAYVHEKAVLVRKDLDGGVWTVVAKPPSFCPNCGAKVVKR